MSAPADLREFSLFAERLADAARRETLPRFRARAVIDNKASLDFDPVTDADKEGERVQREMIRAVYPKHGIVGEEFGSEQAAAEWRWVLDPVDGTRAFVCGVASWATLIALERNQTPVIGVIDQPFTDERWTGVGGETVYRRGADASPCRTSGLEDLAAARLSTTDPRADSYFGADAAARFNKVAARVRVCRFSLDAYAYALLASGEIDLVIENGLKRHDFAALAPVVEGAGGVITAWSGASLGSDERGSCVAAATPALHAAAVELLRG
ncbi:MAG: inositol monophosphatase family protein [Pseudomonadota bacterium]|nr:inositol monophosphatase family protein [Pseudomonadota bacterium]